MAEPASPQEAKPQLLRVVEDLAREARVAQVQPPENDQPCAKQTFRFRTLTDLEDEAEVVQSVEGLFKPGDTVLIFGPPKSGKSYLMAALIALLCKGEGEFAGQFSVRGKLKVVYVSTEGRAHFRYRFRAAFEEHGVSPEEERNLTFVDNLMVNLFDQAVENNVFRFVEEVRPLKPDVIVFDTFARSIPGGNENETRDAAIVIDNLEKIRRELGEHVTIILIHHTNRAGEWRGNGSYLGAADAIVRVEYTKSVGTRSFRGDGMKDTEDFESIGFAIQQVGDDPKHMAARFLGKTDALKKKDERQALTAEIIGILLEEHAASPGSALTATEIRERLEVKPTSRTVERALKDARENDLSVIKGIQEPKKVGRATRETWCYYSGPF